MSDFKQRFLESGGKLGWTAFDTELSKWDDTKHGTQAEYFGITSQEFTVIMLWRDAGVKNVFGRYMRETLEAQQRPAQNVIGVTAIETNN